MIQDKNRCAIKDKLSIKISFMHNRNEIKWARGKLPAVFEEFHMIYIFWHLSVNYSQNPGGRLQPPSFPGFYGPEIGPTHESKQVSKGYF